MPANQTTDGGVVGRNARDLILRLSAMRPGDTEAMAFSIVEQFKQAEREAIAEERERCAHRVESFLGATTESKRFGEETAAMLRRVPSQNQTRSKS